MPSLASASSVPVKARFAISSETANPMPARAPAPATETQPTGGRIRPRLALVTSQVTPVTPAGLPSTVPATMPTVIGDVTEWARNSTLTGMPTLARVNTGTMR